MFKKNNTIVSNKVEVSNYVEGKDIFNSEFLYRIANPSLERIVYEITVYEYRPDLIAKDFYGSSSYMGIVVIQSAVGLRGMTKGSKLLLLPKQTVDNILKNL